ncbi:MAG TPA: methionyl-tRNA formyltransferase [Vicinamibacterales bacterium]|nr:methionyl-tRNA formyltransferase [Vicinamibacterales bacterium]
MVATAPSLRIVFFGTPEFAVSTLHALYESRHQVVGVVTQPDRARGRGQKSQPGPVKQLALQQGSPVLQPEQLRDEDFLASLRALQADLGVVAAYGRILTDAVLQVPRRGLINVHASLLPKYRGAAPIHRAIMAGERETGVTIMRVVKALDAGPMIAKVSHTIDHNDTSSDVERDLARLGARALVDSVDASAEGRATETPQEDEQATYASKIERADGIISWSRPAIDIHNQIRGLHPWPHAFSELDGERIIVLSSEVELDAPKTQAEPGTILDAHGDQLKVQTGDGVLRLLSLQRAGKREVSARDFLAGRPIETGARFLTARLGS